MAFCRKCGAENGEMDKFCGKCGFQSGKIENKSGSKKGFLFIVVIVVVVLIAFGYYYFKSSGAVIGVLGSCPYECCDDGGYGQKGCSRNYECAGNSCIEIDSDNDGLSDIREWELGTNSQLYDTDGDMLSDSEEVNVGTNPLSRNTDGDRYDDNEDSEPLVKNTAEIDVNVVDGNFNWDFVNIGLIAMTRGVAALNFDMVIANPSATIKIDNIGDDYTSYVQFDVVFVVQNEVVSREKVSHGSVSVGGSLTENYNQEITVGDVPDMILELIKSGEDSWEIRIENLEYERF